MLPSDSRMKFGIVSALPIPWRKAVRTAHQWKAAQINTNLSTGNREIGKYAVLLIFVSCVRLQALKEKSHKAQAQLRSGFLTATDKLSCHSKLNISAQASHPASLSRGCRGHLCPTLPNFEERRKIRKPSICHFPQRKTARNLMLTETQLHSVFWGYAEAWAFFLPPHQRYLWKNPIKGF